MKEIERSLYRWLEYVEFGDTYALRKAYWKKRYSAGGVKTMMRDGGKRSGAVRTFLLCWLVLAVFLAGSLVPAFAGVTLSFEDYVYFGKFAHKEKRNGNYEANPSLVLWQTRSTDADSAVLLTHYLVDLRLWNSNTDGMNSPLQKEAWVKSSDLRIFLNSADVGGFLENFTTAECDIMSTTFTSLDVTYVATDIVTLPSLLEISNDQLMGFQNDEARKTEFKNADDSWHYWLRSAGGGITYSSAATVYASGELNSVGTLVNFFGGGGVRPASQISLNPIIFKSGSDPLKPTAEGGQFSNPYVLYTASADMPIASADISVSGNKLTLSFGQPAAHAYVDTASADVLAAKFTVSDDQGQAVTVSGGAFESGKLVLTLGKAAAYGGVSFSIAYRAYASTDTDGVGLLTNRLVVKSLGSGTALAATNKTPDPNPGGDPDPGKTPVSINGADVASIFVSGSTLTISWRTEGKADTAYNLNQNSVTVTYGESRFTVALNANGELVVTGDGQLLPGGTIVLLTATNTAATQGAEAKSAAAQLRRGASYSLGEAKAAIANDKCVFSFPAAQVSKLPEGTYDLTFATSSGANPAFKGTFALGYVHALSRPAAPEILLSASETASGGGVQVSAGVTSGDLPQAGVTVAFTLTNRDNTHVVSLTRTTDASGKVAAFVLDSGLANGTYTVTAAATGYAAVSKSVTVSNGRDGGEKKGGGSGGCDAGLGLFAFFGAVLFAAGRRK